LSDYTVLKFSLLAFCIYLLAAVVNPD